MIYNSISDAIGNTPLIRLSKIEKIFDIDAEIYAKLESMNPGGSAKDRVALNMIKCGGITKGMTILRNNISYNDEIVFQSSQLSLETYTAQMQFFVEEILNKQTKFNTIVEGYKVLELCLQE